MTQYSAIFFCASAFILIVLGALHLWVTFGTLKMAPRNIELLMRMQEETPKITRQTSMWQAYVGFNASHSLGCVLFGLIYGYLAWFRSDVLMGSTFLLLVGDAVLLTYGYLSIRYWFRTPFYCVCVANIFYLFGLISSFLQFGKFSVL